MAKFLIRANYVGRWRERIDDRGGESSKRRELSRPPSNPSAGTLDRMYSRSGHGSYAIRDLPDNASATAVSRLINASGAASLNPDSVDETPRMSTPRSARNAVVSCPRDLSADLADW